MRLLVFHGYLLRGTGSNVYNAELARALVRAGNEVHLLCQERAPDELPFVDAVGDWDEGVLRVRVLREPVRCTVYRPDIDGLLPVYVADRYEGVEARPFPELSDGEIERYVTANVAAVRQVAGRARPEGALANHLVMGPAILARALADLRVPYVVKIHGSALEYTVKPHPRFLPWAREGIAGARAVLVGSRHTARSLWDALDDPELPERTRLGPPGVDVHAFAPRDPETARAGVERLAERMAQQPAGVGFGADAGAAAAALARLDPKAERPVAFVGKLIVSKGVDLLVAAWPLVLEREPRARLLVVGFGEFRPALEALARALGAGDLDDARAIAARGRAAEGGAEGELTHLAAFLDDLDGEALDTYVAAARALPDRVDFLGRLEHSELADLLPAMEAEVVPSTFPEAFGMVAVEAASCGVLPICAAHSGLVEVTDRLAGALPTEMAPLMSFPVDDGAVPAIAERVATWLGAEPAVRAEARAALARRAHAIYSWERVGEALVAAIEGRLDALERADG